jgi:hypothetical protein
MADFVLGDGEGHDMTKRNMEFRSPARVGV